MICGRCGKEITVNNGFCPFCGDPIDDAEWEQYIEDQKLKAEREQAEAARKRVEELQHQAETKARIERERKIHEAQEKVTAAASSTASTVAHAASNVTNTVSNTPQKKSGCLKIVILAAVALAIFTFIRPRKDSDRKETSRDTAEETTTSYNEDAPIPIEHMEEMTGEAEEDEASEEEAYTGLTFGTGTVIDEETIPIEHLSQTTAAQQAEEMVTVYGGIQAPASDFVFPYSSTIELTSGDLAKLQNLSARDLHFQSQLAVNEIFARYGYTFNGISETSKDAIAHFADKEWYQKAQKINPSNDQQTLMNHYFTAVEKANIKAITNFQNKYDTYK